MTGDNLIILEERKKERKKERREKMGKNNQKEN